MEIIETSPNMLAVKQSYDEIIRLIENYRKNYHEPKYHKELFDRLTNEKVAIMDNALLRAYTDALNNASVLKSENARLKRIEKFFEDSLNDMSRLPTETQEFYLELSNSYEFDVLTLDLKAN